MGINIVKGNNQTSMGRRLFASLAPLAGGAIGGPVGTAAGTYLASKALDAPGSDAILGAVAAGVGAGIASKPTAPKTGNLTDKAVETTGSLVDTTDLGDSPLMRRLTAKMQDPQVAIQQGLNTLEQLPVGHSFRKEYAPSLIQARMFKSKY